MCACSVACPRPVQITSLRPWFTPPLRSLPVASLAPDVPDRKSTRLNSSHLVISYAVFCLKKKIEQRVGRPDGAFTTARPGGRTGRRPLLLGAAGEQSRPARPRHGATEVGTPETAQPRSS